MSADAVAVLKDDHRSVEAIFRRFEAAGPRAYATKRKLVDRFIRELSIHAAIEEQVFYPAVRQAVGHTEKQVLESLEEHHLVKITLRELETLEPKDERFDPKVRVLIESVPQPATKCSRYTLLLKRVTGDALKSSSAADRRRTNCVSRFLSLRNAWLSSRTVCRYFACNVRQAAQDIPRALASL